MITETIGAAGDHADFDAALSSIDGVDLADDYTFDFIDPVSTISTNVSGYAIYPNGNTLRVTCSYNENHKGNWQGWYKLSLTSTFGFTINCVNPAKMLGGKFEVDHLYIENNSPSAVQTCMTIRTLNLTGQDTAYQDFHDIYIDGNAKTSSSALLFGGLGLINWEIKIWNMKIWNAAACVYGDTGITGTAVPIVMENVSVYNDVSMFNANGFYLKYPITGKNLVAANNSTGTPADWVRSYNFEYTNQSDISYCADSDGSLVSQFPTETSNIQSSIVPADEFISVDPTNVDFLKLTVGEMEYDAGWNFTPGGVLGENGVVPTESGSTDISGLPRPGEADGYAIGAYEQKYSGGIQGITAEATGIPNPTVAPADVSFTADIELPDRIIETDDPVEDRIIEDSSSTLRIIETTLQ